jgi:rod shape determining protein RodA
LAGFFTPQRLKMVGGGIAYGVVSYVKDTYKTMWTICITTSVFGLLMVYSATHSFNNQALGRRQLIMQCLACFLGYVGAIILSTLDYENLGEIWFVVGGICLFLLLLTFIVGSKATDNADDQSWLRFGSFSFQPAELAKIGLMITLPFHLSKVERAGKLNSLPHLLLVALHAFVPVGIIELQGDSGNAIIFLLAFIILMVCSGVKWYYLLAGMFALGAMLPIFWQSMHTFQRERIRAVYNPRPGDELDILWQQTMSKVAIGSGGIQGKGFMKGPMTQGQVNPEAHNDFIFAVIGEELGFIGTTLAILMLLGIMLLTLRIAFLSRDSMGRHVCVMYFAILASQTILNIGMCVGVLPVIGITLPFFSAGGSSSMCLYFGIGLVVSVYMRRNDATLHFT